jgi:hypothetical protein
VIYGLLDTINGECQSFLVLRVESEGSNEPARVPSQCAAHSRSAAQTSVPAAVSTAAAGRHSSRKTSRTACPASTKSTRLSQSHTTGTLGEAQVACVRTCSFESSAQNSRQASSTWPADGSDKISSTTADICFGCGSAHIPPSYSLAASWSV